MHAIPINHVLDLGFCSNLPVKKTVNGTDGKNEVEKMSDAFSENVRRYFNGMIFLGQLSSLYTIKIIHTISNVTFSTAKGVYYNTCCRY